MYCLHFRASSCPGSVFKCLGQGVKKFKMTWINSSDKVSVFCSIFNANTRHASCSYLNIWSKLNLTWVAPLISLVQLQNEQNAASFSFARCVCSPKFEFPAVFAKPFINALGRRLSSDSQGISNCIYCPKFQRQEFKAWKGFIKPSFTERINDKFT